MCYEYLSLFTITSMKTIIAYHKFCRDGWAAALVSYYWHVQRLIVRDRDVVFLPLLPDEVSKAVNRLILEPRKTQIRFFDLAITKKDVDKLFDRFTDVHIADHHKTTADSFSVKSDGMNVSSFRYSKGADVDGFKKFVFNNDKCGAALAWEYYYPNEDLPVLIKYLQDRDLWRWSMYESKLVNAGLYETLNTPYVVRDHIQPNNGVRVWCSTATKPGFLDPTNKVPDFTQWISYLQSNEWVDDILQVGRTVKSIQEREIKKIINYARVKVWNNNKVYFVNSNVHTSDLGEALYTRTNADGALLCDYVFIWRYDHTTNQCYVSLRSLAETNNDVSTIAKQHGGGGHKHAAGFTCTMGELQIIMLEAI